LVLKVRDAFLKVGAFRQQAGYDWFIHHAG
jgi:hypothetical protein